MAEDVNKKEGMVEGQEDIEQEDIEQEENKTGSDTDNQEEEETKVKGKTFTQDEVNKLAAREKRQGVNSVYKQLGIDPKDKKAVAMFKAIVDSQKSEEQKRLENQNESDQKIAEAEKRAMEAETKAELMMAGVQSQYVEDAMTLVMARISEDQDAKTVISELKTKYSVWFKEAEEDGKKDESTKKKDGTGSSFSSKNNKGDKEDQSLGARLAAQRRVKNNKKSYWD